MLPAREFPEEDRGRTGLESAATPTEAPSAASSGSADADKTAQADGAAQAEDAVQSDKTAQAYSAVQAEGGVQADSVAQADKTVQAYSAVQAEGGVQADSVAQADKTVSADSVVPADSAVQAHSAMQADAGMVAYDSPPESGVSPEAGSSAPDDSVDVSAGQDWHQVLAMFVDDPRGSVAEASAMVDEAINGFIAAARGRQASLAASWQAQDTDTEQLRIALRDYRTLWTSMTQLA